MMVTMPSMHENVHQGQAASPGTADCRQVGAMPITK